MTSIEVQQYLEVDGLRQLTRQQLGSLVNPLTSASARRGRPNRSDGLLKLYGITRADLVAAQRRRQRGIQPHDGRRILLAHERVALTNWLETCSEKRACKSRGMIVEVVCELLEIRRSAREDALNMNSELLDRIPKLSSAELALLARHQEAESSDNPMSQARLSDDWFRGLESDSNIYLTTAVTQNPARVTAATAEACTRHFSSLDELLADLDFVHRSGRHAGMIKTNCKLTFLDSTSAAACLRLHVLRTYFCILLMHVCSYSCRPQVLAVSYPWMRCLVSVPDSQGMSRCIPQPTEL